MSVSTVLKFSYWPVLFFLEQRNQYEWKIIQKYVIGQFNKKIFSFFLNWVFTILLCCAIFKKKKNIF